MTLTLTRTAEQIPDAAEAFLAAHIECNVLATLLAQVRHGGRREPGQLFAWSQSADGGLAFFAMRLPPWPLLATELAASDADALIERWLREDSALPGVSGAPACARAIADAWARQTGGSWKRRMSEAMHVLEHVIDPPHPPAGALRPADERDRSLLSSWEQDFQREARMGAGAREESEAIVDRRIAAGAQWVWDDEGPVSTLALQQPVAGTVRIGPVFTPQEHRRHGYASAAVAQASRNALAGGARRCMLFTDLGNPTSNKIYAAVGFRRHCDWEELELVPAGGVSRFT